MDILTSLDEFIGKYPDRISRSVVLYPKDLKKEGNILYLPMYMAPFL